MWGKNTRTGLQNRFLTDESKCETEGILSTKGLGSYNVCLQAVVLQVCSSVSDSGVRGYPSSSIMRKVLLWSQIISAAWQGPHTYCSTSSPCTEAWPQPLTIYKDRWILSDLNHWYPEKRFISTAWVEALHTWTVCSIFTKCSLEGFVINDSAQKDPVIMVKGEVVPVISHKYNIMSRSNHFDRNPDRLRHFSKDCVGSD